MHFNKKHGIKTTTEYLNISITEDSVTFLDPSKVYHYRRQDFPNKLHKRLKVFFATLFENYIYLKDKSGGVDFLKHLHEPPEYGIGYSNGNKLGKAVGKEKALGIYEGFESHLLTKSGLTILTDPFSILLMIEGIGQDNLSDVILNVGRDLFCEFTETVCKKYCIPNRIYEIEYFCPDPLNWQRKSHHLPYDEDGNKIILIPKWLLQGKKDFTSAFNRHICKRYIWKEMTENNDISQIPSKYYRTVKGEILPNVKAILKDYRRNKSDFGEFILQYNGSIQTFLDEICLNYPEIGEKTITSLSVFKNVS